MIRTPILDSTRSLLLNQAMLARDAETSEQNMSITIGTLGALGLSTVSPTQWALAEDAFQDLQALYGGWQLQMEPYDNYVETGVHGPTWDAPTCVMAEAINSCLNFLVCLGFLRNWTPRDRVALDRMAQTQGKGATMLWTEQKWPDAS